MKKDYDAFCVFDADNVVDPAFPFPHERCILRRREGRKGRDAASKSGRQPTLRLLWAVFYMLRFLFSRARMNCGFVLKLVGTGFAVHRSVLEKSGGWSSMTIAEDAEFAAYLAETGTRVWFVPEAVTYDEAPTSVLVSAAAAAQMVERA